MRKTTDKQASCFFRSINGTKGVISIMLALLMMPMLSIALILVESARYQSAIETLEELLDSAGLSTLADYDSYLEDRFGVLALSQADDASETFSGYLQKNMNLEGNSVTMNSVEAVGCYDLGNADILKQQLLEYSELIVPTQAVYDIADLGDIISNLEGELGEKMQKIINTSEVIGAGGELASDFAKFVKKMKEHQEKYDETKQAETDYETAYTAFEDAVLILASEIRSAKEDQGDSDDPEDIYDRASVQDALQAVEEKRDEYRDAADTFASKLDSFGENTTGLIGTLETLCSDVNDIKRSYGKATDNKSDSITDTSVEWLIDVIEEVGDIMTEAWGDTYDDKVNQEVESLENQQADLCTLTPKSWVDETITQDDVSDRFGPISIDSLEAYSDIAEIIAGKMMGEDSEEETTSALEDAENILDLVDNLLDISLVYDTALNALVPSSSLYNSEVSSELYGELISDSLNNLLTAFHDVYQSVANLTSENKNIFGQILAVFTFIWNLVKALAKLLLAIAEFLGAIVLFVGDIVAGLATLTCNGISELYNSLLLTGYAGYTLPNRTNYDSGKTLTGYSYSKVFEDLAGGSQTHRLSASLKNWAATGTVTQSHPLFYGAEMEYIAIGTQDEIDNQSAAFFAIYLLRLVMDFEPVCSDGWVQMEVELANAASMGTAGTILQFVIVLLEPLLDTIILVNGGKEYMFKDTIYLTPAGLLMFAQDLGKNSGLADSIKTDISDGVNEYQRYQSWLSSGTASTLSPSGILNMSYAETMMLLCLLTVDQDTLLVRIQNLIQMEGAYYYRNKFDFTLDHAYTYIHSSFSGVLNPLFQLDQLGDGPFAITRSQYTGY